MWLSMEHIKIRERLNLMTSQHLHFANTKPIIITRNCLRLNNSATVRETVLVTMAHR